MAAAKLFMEGFRKGPLFKNDSLIIKSEEHK